MDKNHSAIDELNGACVQKESEISRVCPETGEMINVVGAPAL
jgi:hypothetical protein